MFDRLDDPQSAVALYIYRVGWTYPASNPFYRSRSIRILIVLGFRVDWSDRSDPPIRPIGALPDKKQDRPVKPLTGAGPTGLF